MLTGAHSSAGDQGGVLVVVPTLNEARTIAKVLAQLSSDLPRDRRVLFVVADGGSTDGTQEIVRDLSAHRADVVLLANPKRLQSAAVNLAVQRHGKGMEYLVRCDAHSSYPGGLVGQLVGTAERIGSDAVVVPMDTVGRSGLQQAIAWISDTWLGSGGSAHRGGRRSGFVDHGHHALVRIDSFRLAGGYDESFSHNEDAEFDCRLRAVGGTIYLDADIRIAYFPRSTLSKLARQYFNYGMGRSRTVRRHPASLRIRQLAVPGYLSVSLLGLVLAMQYPLLALPAFVYLGVIAAASLWFLVRTGRTEGLLTGLAALTMHCAWAAGFVRGILTVRTS